MSEFVDRLLLMLSKPAQLVELLAPSTDPGQVRIRALLSAVYDMLFAEVHSVQSVQVRQTQLQHPLFPPRRTSGTWTQTTPSYERTDVVYESSERSDPVWLDLSAQLTLTTVLKVDAGQVESVLIKDVAGFNSLAEFRARFRFIDLDAFMAKHEITTVEELKEAYHYLLAEVRLRAPGPFNPADPANEHRQTLNVAILIRDAIDVANALRDAKLARAILEHTVTYQRELETADVRTPYALVVVFPQAALAGLPFDEAAVSAFFAVERVLALFVTLT